MKRIGILLVPLLCIVFLIAGFGIAGMNEYQFREERVDVVLVTCEQDLLNLGDGIYNDRIKLANNIEISSAVNLNSEKHPFIGVFDGNGYTITYKGSMEQSFLGYIGEGGRVCNLNMVVDSFAPDGELGGVIAVESDGVVMDCTVSVGSYQTNNEGSFGSVVAVNNGIIEHTIATVSFSNQDPNGMYTIGGIAAHNYSIIRYCVTSVAFDGYPEVDNQYALEHSLQNTSIGAIYGAMGIKGTVQQSCTIIDQNTVVWDRKDNQVTIYHDRLDVFNAEIMFKTLLFNEKAWRFQGDQFRLIAGRIEK